MTSLSDIRQKIVKYMPQPTLSSLEEIQKDLAPHITELALVKKDYILLINQYYSANPPLYRGQEPKAITSQIAKLVGYATIVDSRELLDRWFINRLNDISTEGKRTIIKLVEESMKQPGVALESLPYYTYLLEKC
jgi:hypothetical protein